MTDTDKVFQIAANRIQGLTRQVNHWKERTSELEAALGSEKAARISAEATLSGQIAKQESAYWRGLHQEAMGALAQEREHREKERDGLTTQIQDLRNEIARLRTDLRDMSERSNGSEWEQKAVELEELRAELNLVKQERDCAKDEWDREEERCKGLASDIEILRVELRESQKEAVTARQDAVTRAEADRKRIDGLMIQAQDMRAEIERLKKPRQHPVKVGESVRRTTEGSIAPIGTLGRVLVVGSDAYQVELRKGFSTMWAFDDCTPCDPPPEASHITPEGKQTAEGAVEPKPGDKVRLVRVPTKQDCKEYDYTDPEQRRLVERRLHTTGTVLAGKHECGCLKVQMAHSAFVKAWPQSCIEIVDAK